METHMRYLGEEIDELRSTIEKGRKMGVDRIFLVEDDYALTLSEARFSFIRQFISEINDGTLTVMNGKKRVWRIARPELALQGSELQEEEKPEDTL